MHGETNTLAVETSFFCTSELNKSVSLRALGIKSSWRLRCHLKVFNWLEVSDTSCSVCRSKNNAVLKMAPLIKTQINKRKVKCGSLVVEEREDEREGETGWSFLIFDKTSRFTQ